VPTPDYILALRRHVGQELLWVSGVTAVVYRGAVGDPELLLVRRSQDGPWSSVTGIVDPGEDPAVAAVREVLEEAGVEAEAERLAWVSTMRPIRYENGDAVQALDFTFRCRYLGGEAALGDDENVDVGWFPRGRLPELLSPHETRIREAFEGGPGARFER
jgi:8-oxo-dGTP pyrophosphatase MutT (NUDIX family)